MDTRIHPIRAARLKKRLTQQRLAAKVGVTKASVSGWECGNSEPAPRTAIALVKLLPSLKFEDIYAVEPPCRKGSAANEHGLKAA